MTLRPLDTLLAQLKINPSLPVSPSNHQPTLLESILRAEVLSVRPNVSQPNPNQSASQPTIPLPTIHSIVSLKADNIIFEATTTAQPLEIGDTLALKVEPNKGLKIVEHSHTTGPALLKANLAAVITRQDSLVPLLKVISQLVQLPSFPQLNHDQATKVLTQASEYSLQQAAQWLRTNATNPITQTAESIRLPTSIGADDAPQIVKGRIDLPPPNQSTSTVNPPLHSAFNQLLRTPLWPEIAVTLLALHASHVQLSDGIGQPRALQEAIQMVSHHPVRTMLDQPSHQTTAGQSLVHTPTTLLFRLAALLEVAQSPQTTHTNWFSQWQSLHGNQWAKSLPTTDLTYPPWSPPITTLQQPSTSPPQGEAPAPNWLDGMIKVLLHQTTAAIARLSTMQLLNLQARTEPVPTILQTEIPLNWQGQWSQATIRIEEQDSHGSHQNQKHQHARKWSVHLNFTLDKVGTIVVQFTLLNTISRGKVWVERMDTFHQAKSQFSTLINKLKAIGVEETDWQIQQGLPPEQHSPTNRQIVDIKT